MRATEVKAAAVKQFFLVSTLKPAKGDMLLYAVETPTTHCDCGIKTVTRTTKFRGYIDVAEQDGGGWRVTCTEILNLTEWEQFCGDESRVVWKAVCVARDGTLLKNP